MVLPVLKRQTMDIDSDYVDFGNVARDRCGQQSQYASRHLNPLFANEYEQFQLRTKGDPDDYHFLKIHKNDVEEFVRLYKKAQGREA